MSNLYIYVLVGIFGAALVLGIVYLFLVAKQREDDDRFYKKITVRGNGKNHLYYFFIFFNRCPGLNKYFKKVLKTVEGIYPADPLSINIKATNMMLKNLITSIGILAAIILMAGGDVFYIAMGMLASGVLFDHRISSSLRKKEFELLRQLQSFLSDVRHYYMQSRRVEDAIAATLDDIPYEISLHIQKVHDIISSPIMEEKVEEYAQSNPNRFFMLLTSICAVIKEHGDSNELESSNFLESIAYLKEEVNTEILKKERIDYKFKMLSSLALWAAFFIKPIEMWCLTNMPDLEEFYTGLYGRSIMVGIFVLSFICYKLVEILKDAKKGDIRRMSIWTQVSNIPVISRNCNRIINRYYTKAMKLNDDMKEVGDHTGPKAFIVQSLTLGIAGFFIINAMFGASIIGEKITMINTFIGNFDSVIVPNTVYLAAMEQVSNDYAKLYKNSKLKDLDEDAMTSDIMANTNVRNEEYARMVAQGVIKQIKAYKNTYYKWWQLLISMFGAVIAAIVPYGMLRFKIKVASVNKEDEVNQFQTLVLILMNTSGIKVDDILEWMDRFSYSFKSSIEICITELEMGEQKALEKMKMSETFQPFKRFCDCLLEIDSVGVKKAFDEIATDRAYSLKNREQQNEMITNDRASKAMWISYTPVMTELVLYLIAPMLLYSIKLFLAMDLSI